MSAFAIAVPLCILFYPELQAGLLALSSEHCRFRRVILGMHFVSDVVVGSLLGAGVRVRSIPAVSVT